MKGQDNFLLDDTSRTGGDLTPKAMDDLRVTAMWVTYIGILGLIVTTLLFIGMFIALFSLLGTGISYGTPFYLGMIFALAFFMFGFYLSLLLYQYGAALKKFFITGKHYDLEVAMEKQKIYWIIGGIAATLLMLFYVVTFVVGFVKG